MTLIRTWIGEGVIHGPGRDEPASYVIELHSSRGIKEIQGRFEDVSPALMGWLSSVSDEELALTIAEGGRHEGLLLRSFNPLGSSVPFYLNGFRPAL